MVVLRAIGRFFARIGRWIRDTAWVQPLLIVGGIFAVIFSIPYLTNWVKSWFTEGDAATAYYKKNKLSWSGVKDGNSEVDKLFQYLENPDTANQKTKDKFGRKFFVNFVQTDCAGCENNFKGYKDLQNKWNKYYIPTNPNEKLKMFNVFIDEEIKLDDSDDTFCFTNFISGDKTSCRYVDIFDDAAALVNPYMDNSGKGDSMYAELAPNTDTFSTPVTFLIDFDFEGDSHYQLGQYGITEIFFSIEGKDGKESDTAFAQSILDCWNHEGEFKFHGVND